MRVSSDGETNVSKYWCTILIDFTLNLDITQQSMCNDSSSNDDDNNNNVPLRLT